MNICSKHLNSDLKRAIVKSENLYRAKKMLETVDRVEQCTIFFQLFNTFMLFDEVYSEIQDVIFEDEE